MLIYAMITRLNKFNNKHFQSFEHTDIIFAGLVLQIILYVFIFNLYIVGSQVKDNSYCKFSLVT